MQGCLVLLSVNIHRTYKVRGGPGNFWRISPQFFVNSPSSLFAINRLPPPPVHGYTNSGNPPIRIYFDRFFYDSEVNSRNAESGMQMSSQKQLLPDGNLLGKAQLQRRRCDIVLYTDQSVEDTRADLDIFRQGLKARGGGGKHPFSSFQNIGGGANGEKWRNGENGQ